MSLPNYSRPDVKVFGEKVNAAMYDASIRASLGGLGDANQMFAAEKTARDWLEPIGEEP